MINLYKKYDQYIIQHQNDNHWFCSRDGDLNASDPLEEGVLKYILCAIEDDVDGLVLNELITCLTAWFGTVE